MRRNYNERLFILASSFMGAFILARCCDIDFRYPRSVHVRPTQRSNKALGRFIAEFAGGNIAPVSYCRRRISYVLSDTDIAVWKIA